ncbi:hypothetical protein TVAG_483740 [Trichomonas vaginalis G3]|uniref:phosphatidyl-N-methylethanolamine N-methyltransferase n=1 Tax=Trichomonas vaginalis (strain ATCC PRA-98 / G3) TaxID=412133 RepID=A2EA18_TRIV3|nr:phosphatidylethanolamine N-methyltransferase family [Trichomonas vaginalis G3]EAY10464.1 hypothetical protein TVAG_483740 [Trichomonas vaginalis G3]KAI5489308.1 phosphatidylethanolamine N-methyltransferase family [Trichomonas vaginalis G3]|eukprot:XP_001322687.1 hypothetical protein [Trichomonas vaginalis G3]
MLSILIIPCLLIATAAQAWAYTDPESFNQQFNQQKLIACVVTCYFISLLFFIIIGSRKGFNKHGLWMAIPLLTIGSYLTFYSTKKIGIDRTFFGEQLGTLEGKEHETSFPFSLNHCMYKGELLLVFGFWSLFYPSKELTFVTGTWICLLLIQMYIESPQ